MPLLHYRCVELTTGSEDEVTFAKLATAAEHTSYLNRRNPTERWTVMPLLPYGPYTELLYVTRRNFGYPVMK